MRDLINIVENAQAVVPKPYRLEYPYGLPGDPLRGMAHPEKATCVAYYRGIDPELLRGIQRGNKLRYDVGELVQSMTDNGYQGGDGRRILLYVDANGTPRIGEGNHRLTAALEAHVPVEIEVRYEGNSDLEHLIWPFDPRDPTIRVID